MATQRVSRWTTFLQAIAITTILVIATYHWASKPSTRPASLLSPLLELPVPQLQQPSGR